VRGLAWPSQAALAKGLGLSERHVRRLLGQLKQGGWVVAHRAGDVVPDFRGDGRSSAYWIRTHEGELPPADLPCRAGSKPTIRGHAGPQDTGQDSGHGTLERPKVPASTTSPVVGHVESHPARTTSRTEDVCFVCGAPLPFRSGPICAGRLAEHVRLVEAARVPTND
jgi:hypothetical protein